MTLNERINSFAELGDFLKKYCKGLQKELDFTGNTYDFKKFYSGIVNVTNYNPWFTTENVSYEINSLSRILSKKNLKKWLSNYPELENLQDSKKIGVVMAGNIPLVGFHDLLCVLITGNIFIGKLSSKDDKLLKVLTDVLISINSEFRDKIFYEDERLKEFDAIIATGSNNTSRYFEYYFGKYPNIIRKNRNSVAILSGNESFEELQLLAADIFLYFGLGCRNVSKLFVPENYDFNTFFEAIEKFKNVINHHKYANNYDYNKSIFLLNKVKHLDNGFLLLKEDEAIQSPISTLNYQAYKFEGEIIEDIKSNNENIQCIISNNKNIKNSIRFGNAQKPELWDYSDNIDTIEFLLNLNKDT